MTPITRAILWLSDGPGFALFNCVLFLGMGFAFGMAYECNGGFR